VALNETLVDYAQLKIDPI